MARKIYLADQSGGYFIKEPTLWVIPLTRAGAFDPLRAVPSPRSDLYALAYTVTVTAGTALYDLWIWNDTDTTADDDATVIKPDDIAASDDPDTAHDESGGRWLKLDGTSAPV